MLYQRESATRLFSPNHEPHAAGAQIHKLAIGRPDDAWALGRIKSLHPPLPLRVANSMSTDVTKYYIPPYSAAQSRIKIQAKVGCLSS